jgi:hypothetical protein
VTGLLEDGTSIDLLAAGYGQGGWNPTRPYYDGWSYSRWYKVAELLHRTDWGGYRAPYARSICRAYAASNGPRLVAVRVDWVELAINPPGRPPGPWLESRLVEARCEP